MQNKELEAIMEASVDEIFVTDGQGFVIRVNSACEKYYRVSAAEIVGKHVEDLEKRGVFYPSATSHVIQQQQSVEIFQRTQKGRFLFVRTRPVFDEDGQLYRIVSFSRDITDVIQLNERIKELEGELEKYKKELDDLLELNGMIANSTKMKEVLRLVKKVSRVNSTVILRGETGVGKSMIARAIHDLSERRRHPFNYVNCAALPDSLIDAELFGFVPGSFTGASPQGRKGLIEEAQGGTFFLDEIDELSFQMQAKLLHVLQEKQIRPVGSSEHVDIDVRFITASNKHLEQLVREGKFREDLYYRLNVVSVVIPPLRERKEDIIPLVYHFLDHYNVQYDRSVRFSPLLLSALLDHPWKGNIREVSNVVERIVVTSDSDEVTLNDVKSLIKSDVATSHQGNSLKEIMEKVEREIVVETYAKHPSSYRLAEVLEISQSAAMRKIRKYVYHD
ncbi:sigma-54 interaction domain-containing protein [Desmospora activa]|nr:sigma 54-interacting transcriptional regulator [Desmospora activa]